MRFYRSFKMVIGFTLAFVIAKIAGLNYPLSAGIITMLNMLDTKKESARVAWKRVYSSVMGLMLAMVIFNFIGNDIIRLVLFLTVLIPVSFKLNVREAIIINIVLASHLLELQSVTLSSLSNEFGLVLLGAVIALVMNLHMPNRENKLIKAREDIEGKIRLILLSMSFDIKNLCTISEEDLSLDHLEKDIKEAKRLSYEYMNNYLLKNNRYFLEYFHMRLQQVYRLKCMKERLCQVFINQKEATLLSEFTERIAQEFEELNDGKELLADIRKLKDGFKAFELPKTREEFEERSALFQYVNDLEEFIVMKIKFFEKQLSYL